MADSGSHTSVRPVAKATGGAGAEGAGAAGSAAGAAGGVPSAGAAGAAGGVPSKAPDAEVNLQGATQRLPKVQAAGAGAKAGAPSAAAGSTGAVARTGATAKPGAGAGTKAGAGSGAPSAHRTAANGSASGSVRSAANSSSLGSLKSLRSGDLANGDAASAGDAVASRRLAHGLSPQATSKAEAAELRRKEKEASAEERKRKVRREQRAKAVRRSVIAVALVLIVAIAIAFWLLRWGLHDDAASIQGAWRVQGTDTVITINEDDIVLTDEVAYDYVIDPEAKTLTFTFGGLSGNGRYRFSLDHSMLAIDDGEFDWGSTLAADIPWTLEAVSQELVGNPEKSPALGAGDMVLERIEQE